MTPAFDSSYIGWGSRVSSDVVQIRLLLNGGNESEPAITKGVGHVRRPRPTQPVFGRELSVRTTLSAHCDILSYLIRAVINDRTDLCQHWCPVLNAGRLAQECL